MAYPNSAQYVLKIYTKYILILGMAMIALSFFRKQVRG